MGKVLSKKTFMNDVVFEAPVRVSDALLDVNGVAAAYDAVFVIGTEAATVINIAVQVRDAGGKDIAHRHMMFGWISSDAVGDVIETTAPDTLAIGTDGTLFPSGGDSIVMFHALTEADGDLDIDCTQDALDVYYLNLLIGGKVWTSGAISHAGP